MNMLSPVRSVPIGEVATLNPKGPTPGLLEGGRVLDFLPMADLSEDGTMTVSAQRPYAEVAKGYTAFRHGDVLLAKITPCFENNKIGLADVRTEWAFGSTEFHVIRPGKDVDARYLLHFLRQDTIRGVGEKRMTGSGGQRRVPKSFLEELPIPLPPLPEQKRIAAILDQADELRAKRRAAIAHLDSLTDAIFLDMFGDPALSQRFVALGDITASARLGLVRSSKQLSEGGPYPYIRMNAISANGRLDSSSLQRTFASRDELASSTLDRGDLLFNTRNSRDLVGKCAVFRGDERCLFNNNLLRLRFTDGIAPEFVWAVLNSTYGKRELMSRASGTTSVFAIYAKDLASVPIPLADPDRQALFSDAVAEVDSNRSQHTTSLSALDVLFASLQARAFAGDL